MNEEIYNVLKDFIDDYDNYEKSESQRENMKMNLDKLRTFIDDVESNKQKY